jgi:hypothetical protein
LNQGNLTMLFKQACLLVVTATLATAFAPANTAPSSTLILTSSAKDSADDDVKGLPINEMVPARRSFMSSLLVAGGFLSAPKNAFAAEEAADEESFASLAARAALLSSDVGDKSPPSAAMRKSDDPRTAYDFSMPIEGKEIPFLNMVHQEYDEEGRAKLKAILVVNMKEDDPIARKDIPEFIALAAKYVWNE